MKVSEVVKEIRLDGILKHQKDYVNLAEKKHPKWGPNLSRGLTIITEEVGELAEAINKYEDEGGDFGAIELEAFHVLATTTRFLLSVRKRKWNKK